MNIYDKIKKGQEEQIEIIKSVLGETTEDMIEKAKKANIGDIRIWNGKKYKKQANGKWMEVSEHGMTKEEHRIAKVESARTQGRHNPGGYEDTKKHREAADKLSDKEYDEGELDKESSGEKKETEK